MHDPLSDVVRLLRPSAVFANAITGKGAWAVRYTAYGKPGFCIVLDGSARLAVDGHAPITIAAGDFVLLPTTPAFTLSSLEPGPVEHLDPHRDDPMHDPAEPRERRHGEPLGPPDMRSIGGAFLFDRADTALLISLLPAVVHVQGSRRFADLVRMVDEEVEGRQPGHDYVLSRLAEMMLVEAMRWTTTGHAPPGLLRGLGDARLAPALAQMHARVAQPWTVAQLAAIAALSRSSFFDRFTRTVGVAPMEYLLAWRMELAKDLLRREHLGLGEVAERVGYGSSSAFSIAFRRHVGMSPGRYGAG